MKKTILFLGIFIFLIATASSLITISNSSIDKDYFTQGTIKGEINMSLNNEPTNTIVVDTELGEELTLIDFLKKTLYSYTCAPTDCLSSYTSEEGKINDKSISLLDNDEKIVGLKYIGDLRDITTISFNITSDAQSSQKNQLKIDILDDGTFETGNIKVSQITSPTTNFGCFSNSGNTVQETKISRTPYCQRINIKESPGLKVGAWIKKDTGTQETNITMYLFGTNGVQEGKCNINSTQITTSGEFVSCDINYLNNEAKDYYVCVNNENDIGVYNTKNKILTQGNYCGFRGRVGQVEDELAAYEIGIREKQFSNVGELEIQNTLSNGMSFSNLVKTYISDKYNNDCNSQVCYVPIKIKSGINQNIVINNVINEYTTTTTDTTSRDIYGINMSPATISANNSRFSIDDIFKIKDSAGFRDYKLKIGTKTAVDEKINVKLVSFELNQYSAISGKSEEFKVSSDINKSIVLYSWDFGDNSTIENSTQDSIIHTYKEIGTYKLKVKIKDKDGNVLSKEFNIDVSTAKKLVESKLKIMISNLTTIKSEIQLDLTEYQKKKLLEEVDIDSLLEKITELNSSLGINATAEKYGEVLDELYLLDTPTELVISSPEEIPFFPLKDEIDVSVLKEITSEDSKASESQISQAINLWSKKDIRVSIKEDKIILKWKNKETLVLKTFNIILNPKAAVAKYYLIFDNKILNSVDVNSNETINGKSYIEILGNRKIIEFSSDVDILFSDLPIVITPAIKDLELVDTNIDETKSPLNKPLWIFLGILGAIIIGIIFYFILRYWYKVNYEKKLFKDRNNLYNVMLYVNKNIKAGVSLNEIKETLKKSGWSSEQIRYILRKYEGRETGMPKLGFASKKINIEGQKEKNMFQDRKYKP